MVIFLNCVSGFIFGIKLFLIKEKKINNGNLTLVTSIFILKIRTQSLYFLKIDPNLGYISENPCNWELFGIHWIIGIF